MPFLSWWRQTTRTGKAALLLVSILVLQIALALSTQYTVLPAVEAITHESWHGELGPFLLFFIQVLLCIPTIVLLIVALAILAIRSHRRAQTAPSIIPRDFR